MNGTFWVFRKLIKMSTTVTVNVLKTVPGSFSFELICKLIFSFHNGPGH